MIVVALFTQNRIDQVKTGFGFVIGHRTSQWPPLAGPMRRKWPRSCKFLMFRSMDRSVTPINEASSGMVKCSSCFNAARISPDGFSRHFFRTERQEIHFLRTYCRFSVNPCREQATISIINKVHLRPRLPNIPFSEAPEKRVHVIDIFEKRVHKNRKYRHVLTICRFHRHVPAPEARMPPGLNRALGHRFLRTALLSKSAAGGNKGKSLNGLSGSNRISPSPSLLVRNIQSSLFQHPIAKCIQLRPGQLGRFCLAVFPAIDRGIAHAQLPGQILLAQGKLPADFLYQ